MLGFYSTIQDSFKEKSISETEFYSLVRENETIKTTTDNIILNFKDGIEANWEGYKKNPYQDAKKSLHAVTISTNDDRVKNNTNVTHSTLICFDLDENTPEELFEFRQTITEQDVPYIRSAAFSVSGAINGSMWAVVKVDTMDVTFQDNERLFALLGLKEQSSDFDIMKTLHIAYTEFIGEQLKVSYGINYGKASKNFKACRYIASDSSIYVNLNADEVKLKDLTAYLERTKEERAIKAMKRTIKINKSLNYGSDWMNLSFAHAQSLAEDIDNPVSNKRMCCFNYGMKASLLGVDIDSLLSSVKDLFDKEGFEFTADYREQAETAYANYTDSFGCQSYLLTKVDSDTLNIGDGYLSKVSDSIISKLEEYKRIDLIAPTGCGKNYTSVNVFGKWYTENYGGKTIISVSLNSKAKKDAVQYGIPCVTGEILTEKIKEGTIQQYWDEVLASDVIMTNYNQLPDVLLQVQSVDKKAFVIKDEVQITAKGYRAETTRASFKALERDVVQFVMLMTGTAKDYFDILGYHRIVVKSNKKPINVKIAQRSTKPALDLEKVIQENPNKRILCKYNDIAKLEEIRDILIERNILNADEILLIHSKLNDSEKTYEERLNSHPTDSFEGNVKLVLCTSAINEGLDIYSTKEILAFNFERTGIFEIDSFIQFIDRWRTKDVVKDVIFFTPSLLDARGLEKFNVSYEAKATYEQATLLADTMNKSNSRYYSTTSASGLNINVLCNGYDLVRYDDDKQMYVPDFISTVLAVEQEYARKCTVQEGFLSIAKNYPYVNIDFSGFGEQEDHSEEDVEEVEAIELTATEALELSKTTFGTLFRKDPYIATQAVRKQSEADIDLMKKIGSEDITRKVEVNNLIENNQDVFNKHLKFAVKVTESYLDLTNERKCNLTEEQAFEIMFVDGVFKHSSVKDFITGYTLHFRRFVNEQHSLDAESAIQTIVERNQAATITGIAQDFKLDVAYTKKQGIKEIKKLLGRRKLPVS